eukprot:335019-Rhodomonas_salina.1
MSEPMLELASRIRPGLSWPACCPRTLPRRCAGGCGRVAATQAGWGAVSEKRTLGSAARAAGSAPADSP